MSEQSVSRWVLCPRCGSVGELLATQVGCTNNDRACRNWNKSSREAWARAGYPQPGEFGRQEFGFGGDEDPPKVHVNPWT